MICWYSLQLMATLDWVMINRWCFLLISIQRAQCWNYWGSADNEDSRGTVGALKTFCKREVSWHNFKMIDSLNSLSIVVCNSWDLSNSMYLETAWVYIEKSRINWLPVIKRLLMLSDYITHVQILLGEKLGNVKK